MRISFQKLKKTILSVVFTTRNLGLVGSFSTHHRSLSQKLVLGRRKIGSRRGRSRYSAMRRSAVRELQRRASSSRCGVSAITTSQNLNLLSSSAKDTTKGEEGTRGGRLFVRSGVLPRPMTSFAARRSPGEWHDRRRSSGRLRQSAGSLGRACAALATHGARR